MKVVILAGGLGTRISEYTSRIPKPMVEIGSKPILWHIMRHYARYSHKDFFLALGYKSSVIKEYFLNYHQLNSNFKINLSSGELCSLDSTEYKPDWNINLIDTGLMSMTGGRIKRIASYIEDEVFLMTYGDGLSDVNIDALVEHHMRYRPLVTVTAVRPTARFGELDIDVNSARVTSFAEKPQTNQGWISGGYFVIDKSFLSYIDDDATVLEHGPLSRLAEDGKLSAYLHNGFWQCMDTKRDHEFLEQIWSNGKAPWK